MYRPRGRGDGEADDRDALVHAGHPCRGEQEASDDDRGADPVRADETGFAGSFVESRESFHEKVAARKRRHEVPAPPKRNPVSSFARLKWC
jgi:hypothetical protein